MSGSVKRGTLCCVVLLLSACFLAGASAQTEETYSVELDGRKTWTLRWGLGDAMGLAASGLSAGHVMLDQTLAVDISGKALSVLSVEAHFDDRQADSLQSLAILLDTEQLDGVLGDFTAKRMGSFASYGKKMKGLQLEYTLGETVWTAVASKLEGITESKTFVGEKAHEEMTYAAYSDTDPSKRRPYKQAIDGLYAYPIDGLYVEEFSEVVVSFDLSGTLGKILGEYGLGYLVDTLADDPSSELADWEFVVVGEEPQTLLLNQEARDLVRDRLETAIKLYNKANDLSGDDAKEYPFSRNTAFEHRFLADVSTSVRIVVDGKESAILDAVRQRFFDLGREGIVSESLLVEISLDGVAFDPISSPRLAEYDMDLVADAGILEVDFPDAFFTDQSAMRVNFDYSVSGGVFMLGLSIIPGSDQVRLNESLLERDEDYMIDYEIGMLVLLVEVQETDVVRVDYERFAGGVFGSAADYATYFFGLTLDWPISEHLTIQASLLQSAEDPGSVSDPASVKTMPNRHTVAGISGTIRMDGFNADFLVAYSHDRFPFDENERTHLLNEITAIAVSEEYVFFGHRSGLTVKRGDEWNTYGAGQGLAGRAIRAIAHAEERLFLGTSSGLSVVSLEGSEPFDRIGNWTSYYADEDEGLPSASITALLVVDGRLWVGTDVGLASVQLEQMDEPEAWTRLEDDSDVGAVRALAGDSSTLFIGTDDGVYQYSPSSGRVVQMQGSAGIRIHDLSLFDGSLYVASSRGLRNYRNGVGSGWLILGEPVYAVEASDEFLVYGTGNGLIDTTSSDGEGRIIDAAVTAIGVSADGLWVGTRANAEYELTVWAYGESVESYGSGETKINGQDPLGFADTVAEEHTVEGVIGRASFRHAADGFSIWGRVENVSPAYRSIGALNRSDTTGWDLAAAWVLSEDADVSISHGYDIIGLRRGRPEIAMVNDAALQWTFGPVLTMNVHHEMANDEPGHDGPESSRASYRFSLHDKLFTDRLDVGISWSEGYVWNHELVTPQRDTQLSFTADVTLLPAWSVSVDWGRPIGTCAGAWSGSESLSLSSGWSGDTTWASCVVDYGLAWSRSVPDGVGSRHHEIEFDVDAVPFDAWEWEITPGAVLGASSDESTLDLDGRVSARGRRGGLTIQTALQAGLSGLGDPVVRESEKISILASYSGMESFRPSVTCSIDRHVASYAAQRQVTIGRSLTARLTWSPAEIHHDELSLSLTSKGGAGSRTVTARVENSYRIDLREWTGSWQGDAGEAYPVLTARIDTDMDYRRSDAQPDIDMTTTGQLDVAFSPTWSGSLGISYLGGTGSTGTFYHSLLFELTVAIDF